MRGVALERVSDLGAGWLVAVLGVALVVAARCIFLLVYGWQDPWLTAACAIGLAGVVLCAWRPLVGMLACVVSACAVIGILVVETQSGWGHMHGAEVALLFVLGAFAVEVMLSGSVLIALVVRQVSKKGAGAS